VVLNLPDTARVRNSSQETGSLSEGDSPVAQPSGPMPIEFGSSLQDARHSPTTSMPGNVVGTIQRASLTTLDE